MAATEQRFALESREVGGDRPGLTLGDDGLAYAVAPGGARSRIGGGRPAAHDFVYVPSTGDERTDSAAMQAAIDSLPADGGDIVLDRGPYAFAGVEYPNPVRVVGAGPCGANIGPRRNHYYARGTRINCSSRTASPFEVYADGCQFESLYLQNTAPLPPTEGAGILVAENGNSTEIRHCSVVGFYVDLDVRVGTAIQLTDVMAVDPVLDAISIQNLDASDSGGHFLSECWISAGPNHLAPRAGVFWASGGGTKVENNRIGGEDVGQFAYGCLFELAGTSTATIAEFVGNTIEDLTTGIRVATTGTGIFKKVVVSGNYIDTKAGAGGSGVEIAGRDDTHQILYGNIDGNLINANGAAISLTNAQRVRLGVNEFATSKRGVDFAGTNAFLWMGPNMDYTTATRPSAAMFRVGASYYDTDLHQPLYSDGAGNWRTAAGVIS